MIESTAPHWGDSARRVVIQTANYLEFDGRYSVGGRQRYIRDIALLVKEWGRDVIVVQKGIRAFEKVCPSGISVIGIKADLSALGDIAFAWNARGLARRDDVYLYASGEDSWPLFQTTSKAIQHGVWWDGPQKTHVRVVQRARALSMMRAVRSVLCVDTNFINWLRCLGREGYSLASKCEYIPNYADLQRIRVNDTPPSPPLTIICARRYEHKRGADLLMAALAILRAKGVGFRAHFSTAGGVRELERQATSLGISESVTISEDSMDAVLERYAHYQISVVPTRWSEGTSLACVEALAAGVPVICTPVGGLGNLVFPGFNGDIVPPVPDRLAMALIDCSAPEVLERLRAGAQSMRDSLGIDNWKKRVLTWLAE